MSQALWSSHEKLFVPFSVFVHAIGLLVRPLWVTRNRKCKLNLLKQVELLAYRIKGSWSAFRDSIWSVRSESAIDSPLRKSASWCQYLLYPEHPRPTPMAARYLEALADSYPARNSDSLARNLTPSLPNLCIQISTSALSIPADPLAPPWGPRVEFSSPHPKRTKEMCWEAGADFPRGNQSAVMSRKVKNKQVGTTPSLVLFVLYQVRCVSLSL